MWLRTIWLYVKAVWKHTWWLVAGVVGLIGDGAEVAGADIPVPRVAWYLLAAGAFVIAQFRAWDDMRRDRDAQATLAHSPESTLVSDLRGFLRELHALRDAP